jgi:hypothetical protein
MRTARSRGWRFFFSTSFVFGRGCGGAPAWAQTWTRAGVRGAYSLLSNSFLAGNCRLVLTALTRLHMPGVCRRLVLLYRSTRLMARLVASDARHPRGGG